MKKILLHLDKTENLLKQVKNNLLTELNNCENELVSYEIREALLKVERREFRFTHLKNSLNSRYNRKESKQLKKVYKSLKKMA